MEVIALLQARREKLWEEREKVERKIERIQRGVENEEKRDRTSAGFRMEVGRGKNFGEEAKWRIARLREKISATDVRHGRLEDVIEVACRDMEPEEEGREAGIGDEVKRTIELARKRMERERKMLNLLCEELEVEGV